MGRSIRVGFSFLNKQRMVKISLSAEREAETDTGGYVQINILFNVYINVFIP